MGVVTLHSQKNQKYTTSSLESCAQMNVLQRILPLSRLPLVLCWVIFMCGLTSLSLEYQSVFSFLILCVTLAKKCFRTYFVKDDYK